MRWTLLATAVLLSACVGSSAPALEPLDAQDAWEAGLAAGTAWQADARLVGVAASEHRQVGPAPANESALDRLLRRTTDADLGDGMARIWTFTHQSAASNLSYTVAVGSTGVLAHEVHERPSSDTALEGGISSGQAARALANDTDWTQRVDSLADNGSVMMVLTPWGGRVVWVFAALDEDTSYARFVDAVSGEVLDGSWFFAWQEVGQHTGSATLAVPASSFSFELRVPHSQMALRFVPSPDPTLPGHGFRATLTWPDGQQVLHEWQAGIGAPDPGLVVGDVGQGEVQVTVEMTRGAASGWRLAWCTDGAVLTSPPNEACEIL